MSSPVNPIKQRPLEPIYAELAAMGAPQNGAVMIAFRDMLTRSDKTTTNAGAIQPQAPVVGRNEGIGTTVQNISSAGVAQAPMVDFSVPYANKDTDHISDGTGTPLAGGKRGAIALNTNNQLSSSFREQPVNVMAVSASASILSNDGVSKTIVIAASSIQFGAGVISYNAGSVNPGVFGTFYIYASDPTFAGGAVTYQFATTVQTTASGDGFVFFGKITTVNGTPNTGGGQTGGTTPGGFGGNRGA